MDVRPFLKACLQQKEFFYMFGLDQYKDGFSLPSLSEKIMFSYMLGGLEEFKKKPIEKQKYELPNNIDGKIAEYKYQDIVAKRDYDEDDYICRKDIKKLINKQSFKCYYCHNELNNQTWTLDRIECDVPHTKHNCIISCEHCNVQRKDDLFKRFLRKKQLLRYSKVQPMIYLIDEANKEVFYKLRESITGGASIVFHRYHEADKTVISRVRYDAEKKKWDYEKCGNKVKKIIGYDCNALYLWCIGQDMLCGKLEWIETDDMKYVKNARKNKFYGMLSVDIHCPEDKYNYFSEMCPIFKNMEYSQEICGEYMKDIIKKNQEKQSSQNLRFWEQPKCRRHLGSKSEGFGATTQNPDSTKEFKYAKTRKLIATLKGEKLLIKSTRLKWLMKHGCIVDKLYGVIPAQRGRIFQKFMDKVSEERRKGDIDDKYKIIGEMWKLVGNSAFGRTGMNKNKHRNVKYCNEMQFNRKKYDYFYYDVNIYDDVYEVFSNKKKIRQNMPIQVAASIYDDSKRRMLEFYYDCVDKYIDRKDFQYVQMDTDSAYMALSGNFEDLVKPELKEEFIKDYNNWFPSKDNYAHDIREPGLFKPEFEGLGIVSLCSKMYYALGYDKDKFSCKGMQHANNKVRTSFLAYKDVLFSGMHNKCTNRGFRFINNEIVSYETNKKGLSPVYDKRAVMKTAVHCHPLDI